MTHRVLPLLLLILLAALTPAAHAMLEGTFLYFPTHRPNTSPLQEWRVNNQHIGFLRPAADPASPRALWLILHGNAGQACDRTYITNLLPADSAAYILEYPGYGQRRGKPSLKSINTAAEEAYRALRAAHPGLPLHVLGESLGSGPASHLCTLPQPPERLVLVVPHDNLLSVAKRHMRWLPVSLLMRDKWDNVRSLSAYRGPVLIIAATHDTIIPASHARALAATLTQARYLELPCGHNEWSLFPEVPAVLKE